MAETIKSVRGWATAGTGAIAAAVGGPWVEEIAREQGLYDQPSQRVATVFNFLSSLTDAWWFPWIGGIVVGVTAVAWLQPLLARGTPKPGPSGFTNPAPPPEPPSAPNGEPLLEPFRHKVFRNEQITIDNKSFVNCTFINVTFEYNGGICEFGHNVFQTTPIFRTNNESIRRVIHLLYQFNLTSITIVGADGEPWERTNEYMTPGEYLKREPNPSRGAKADRR